MEISEVIKAKKENLPVTLMKNVISEREILFGSFGENLTHKGIEKNIGKELYIKEVQFTYVRLLGMILEENGKQINSQEIIVPITAIKRY